MRRATAGYSVGAAATALPPSHQLPHLHPCTQALLGRLCGGWQRHAGTLRHLCQPGLSPVRRNHPAGAACQPGGLLHLLLRKQLGARGRNDGPRRRQPAPVLRQLQPERARECPHHRPADELRGLRLRRPLTRVHRRHPQGLRRGRPAHTHMPSPSPSPPHPTPCPPPSSPPPHPATPLRCNHDHHSFPGRRQSPIKRV